VRAVTAVTGGTGCSAPTRHGPRNSAPMRAQPRTCTAAPICTGTALAPAHICTGTALAPAHICTGTALAPATAARPALSSQPLARARGILHHCSAPTCKHAHSHAHTPMCAHWAWLGLAWLGGAPAVERQRARQSAVACAHARVHAACCMLHACMFACCMLHAAGARSRSDELGRLLRAGARGIGAIRHAWVCRTGRGDRAGAKPVGRIRASTSLRPMPRLRRDWAHPMPRLHGDWAHRNGVCAGTGLTPAASAPGRGLPMRAVPRKRARAGRAAQRCGWDRAHGRVRSPIVYERNAVV
jgi:hypothetical protein